MACEITELVGRCLTGDEAAMRQFVGRFQQVVFALCLKMLGHRQDAEDVTQETFLRVFRNLDRWDNQRPILPWLMAIAANRCRTARARRVSRPAASPLLPDPPDRRPESDPELGEELDQALGELREEYQTCFRLFYQQESSCAEIGEVMGVPEGTVKTWLHRARAELAEKLKRRGVLPGGSYELHRL